MDECLEYLDDSKFGKAIDRISLGLALYSSSFLSNLKREGVLRHSSYFTRKNPVPGIAKHILANKELFKLNQGEELYLESLINMERLYSEMKKVYTNLFQYIKNYNPADVEFDGNKVGKKSLVKTLLVVNELAFLTRQNTEFGSLQLVGDDNVNLEQQSDALSYLISFISENTSKNEFDVFMDNSILQNKIHLKLIGYATRLKNFREIEMQIENLGFTCSKHNSKTNITHPDTELLKSIALSNIMSEGQKDADALGISRYFHDRPSIQQIATLIHERFPDAIHFVNKPFPRFRMEISTQLIQLVATEPIGTFYEEYDSLQYIHKELGVSAQDLETFELLEGLTLSDFLKIHRVFIVLQHLFSEQLSKRLNKNNYEFLLSSLLTIFSETAVNKIFASVIHEEKLSRYLNLMSWEYGSNSFLDLQYTPVIKSSNYYVFSLSVLRHSRSIRNAIASLAKRGYNIKSTQMSLIEQISTQLTEVFGAQGFTCFSEVNIKYVSANQKQSDIDFLAYKDGVVFIAECKDVLDSVDSFEYRRISDNLVKAASQLDYIKSALSDTDFRKQLSKRLNIDLSTASKFLYTVVPSSRKVWGYHVSEYPVRNVHELLSFLTHGTWRFQLPNQHLNVFHLWKGDNFDVDDLVTFCSNQGPHSKLFNSVFEYETNIGQKFDVIGYAMDFTVAIEILKHNYKTTIENSSPPYEDF